MVSALVGRAWASCRAGDCEGSVVSLVLEAASSEGGRARATTSIFFCYNSFAGLSELQSHAVVEQ